MNSHPARPVVVLATLALAAWPVSCQGPNSASPGPVRSSATADVATQVRARLELPVSEPPFTSVKANWKERLDQPYVFVELRGTYTLTARRIKDVLDALNAAHVEPAGPPFALFYDDPGTTPLDELRSRACVPVASETSVAAPFEYDVLPQATVAYAYVGGPYGEVPRAYPGIYAFVSKMNWVEAGPVREIYLVPPGSVDSWDQLVCEVQIPTEPRR